MSGTDLPKLPITIWICRDTDITDSIVTLMQNPANCGALYYDKDDPWDKYHICTRGDSYGQGCNARKAKIIWAADIKQNERRGYILIAGRA